MNNTQDLPQARETEPRAAKVTDPGSMPAMPQRHLCVVTCMDARIDVLEAVGLNLGDAHIIRNAGGVVTDDVIRSLMLSQRALGTTDILVMQHTGCALDGVDEQAMRAEIRRDTGVDPPFALGAFRDIDESVRNGIELLRKSPLLMRRDRISGAVYDVKTATVRVVTDRPAPGVDL